MAGGPRSNSATVGFAVRGAPPGLYVMDCNADAGLMMKGDGEAEDDVPPSCDRLLPGRLSDWLFSSPSSNSKTSVK